MPNPLASHTQSDIDTFVEKFVPTKPTDRMAVEIFELRQSIDRLVQTLSPLNSVILTGPEVDRYMKDLAMKHQRG
jgi:hypothetical protein